MPKLPVAVVSGGVAVTVRVSLSLPERGADVCRASFPSDTVMGPLVAMLSLESCTVSGACDCTLRAPLVTIRGAVVATVRAPEVIVSGAEVSKGSETRRERTPGGLSWKPLGETNGGVRKGTVGGPVSVSYGYTGLKVSSDGLARFICNNMKIVGAEGQEHEEFDIPFKLWRKFAAKRRLRYQSWEEGKEVMLNKLDKDLLTDFK